jgi:hypothetical protein
MIQELFGQTLTPEQWYAKYDAQLRRHTRRLVRHHRDSIERVAKALQARETLQADEVDTLLGGREVIPFPAR